MPSKVRFYLNGGGLFTVQGRWWDEQVESLLSEAGAGVYNPGHESEGALRANPPGGDLRKAVFISDREGVDISQGVVMLGEGAAGEVSSGTAWETGYAYARDKLVLCLRTDIRGSLNPLLKECLFESTTCGDFGALRNQVARAIAKIDESGVTKTYYAPPTLRRSIHKVHLTAPYFTATEWKSTKELKRNLSALGLDVKFPPGAKGVRENLTSGREDVWPALFREKVRSLNECDALVALLEGSDCNSELAWDCGYAYSKYKPVFGLRTDTRTLGDLGSRVNLMIEQSLVGSKLCGSASELGQTIIS
ncbi:MAG: nucleoside 2-deoxyribosyltransferase [Nitrososphaerota archaeon]|nr:nucleoside 2-deoxyribosyltransferase [Nitrososphaerota archaeon]